MRYALSNLKSTTYTDGGMGRFRLEYVLHTPDLHTIYTTSLIMRIYVSAIHTTFSSEARAPTKLFKVKPFVSSSLSTWEIDKLAPEPQISSEDSSP